ncbi:transcriptional regulator WhiB [Lentzea sp. NBRC 105346]|uniref:WhiB family transcriptional regulator n=1 Tax=Lentzea sp. NBRC 105346 TaxID=3032205 RepID=UPI0024A3C046|nr:transcriptional regulator WhiB [Lentzea sp. NBRC 105346]
MIGDDWGPDTPAWMKSALCRETDPDAFYPDKGGSTVWAKRVCGNCPVRAECLEHALQHNEKHGVWGGLTERQRRRLQERRRHDNPIIDQPDDNTAA